jgi:transcriptional regulator with XRE-family HTH domain
MGKKREAPTLTDQLREAIRQSGRSLNQLGKQCGLDAARLSRFVRGERGLSLEAIDAIAKALNLCLAVDEKAAGEGKAGGRAGQVSALTPGKGEP